MSFNSSRVRVSAPRYYPAAIRRCGIDHRCPDIATRALCELGYVEALAGRRPSAANYLAEALSYADGDMENLAGVHAFMGFNLVDWGQVELDVSHFEQSLTFARSAGDRRREIWSLGIGAWGNIRSGRLAEAQDWLTSCLTLCDDIRWLAFRPWPIALLAETKMALGEISNSSQPELEEALALSSQLGDPCWQAATARSLAIVHSESENYEMADKWMSHARERCCAVTDLYAGLLVEILSGQIALFQKTGREQNAVEVAREMLSLAARTHADSYLNFAASVINSARI
jgi:tetratricopeptide (TPR) repeat protein